MSGIYVLSDILKGGNKSEKISTSKGKDVADGSENVAAVFAAMICGYMNSSVDSKGQHSKAGKESEEKQRVDSPVQNLQNPIGPLPNLFQPMLQSALPAGKEANSGNHVSQGTGGLANASASLTNAPIVSSNNVELAMLNLVSPVSDEGSAQLGMTTPNPQGDNPGITELDKYRQVIGDFLVALSGEITDLSPKVNLSGPDSVRTKDLSQDLAKIIQGSALTEMSDRLEALSPKLNPENSESSGTRDNLQDLAKIVQRPAATQGPAATEMSDRSEAPSPKLNPENSESSGTREDLQDLAKIVQRPAATQGPAATEMSDRLEAPSPKLNPENSESSGTRDNLQDLAKIVQRPAATQGPAATEMSDRLEALSSKVNPENSESSGTRDNLQDMAKIVQGWMMATDEVAKNGYALTDQKEIQRQGQEDAKAPHFMNEVIEVEDRILASEAKGRVEFFMKPLNGTDLDMAAQLKETALFRNLLQKSDGIVPQENKSLKIFQGAIIEEIQKSDSMQSTKDSGVSGVKDIHNQSLSVGLGVANNLWQANVLDGKTSVIPVWEQISTVLQEQVKNKSQDLKQLDIQLHPEDLGKIQINLRWENGMLHLRVHASEAATGQILQNQLSDLRYTLTSQGVNCGMLEMGQGRERQQNPQGNESQRAFSQNAHPDEDEVLIPISNFLSLGQYGSNRLNVTA